jgi:glucokinase
MENREFTVGVDLGGTNTVIGFVNIHGDFIAEVSFATQTKAGPGKFVEGLARRIKEMQDKLPDDCECLGMGIAAPHVSYTTGKIVAPANLGWGEVNLISMLSDHLDLPIAVLNDANAAALGEMGYGVAKGLRDFVLITLGTGIGSGIIANGQLLVGARGLAGEFGHMTAVCDGRECGCGRRGCVEAYASAQGITRSALELMSDIKTSTVLEREKFSDLTSEKVFMAAQKGDSLAREVFEKTALILCGSLADMAACFDPEAIVLSGGVVRAGNTLLKPLRKHFEESLLHIFKGQIPILISKYPEGQAAVLGATLWLQQSIELPEHWKTNSPG